MAARPAAGAYGVDAAGADVGAAGACVLGSEGAGAGVLGADGAGAGAGALRIGVAVAGAAGSGVFGAGVEGAGDAGASAATTAGASAEAMVKLLLTAEVSPPLACAVNVYVPGVLILQPAKVATPETAAFGFVVQVRVAPPPEVMLRVIEAVLELTVLPPASWTVTTGCVAKAVLMAAPTGEVVKASLLAVPTVMVRLVLTPLVSPLEAAVSV